MDLHSIQAAIFAAIGQKNINKTALRSLNIADLRVLAETVGIPSNATKPDLISGLLEAASAGKACEPLEVVSHPLPPSPRPGMAILKTDAAQGPAESPNASPPTLEPHGHDAKVTEAEAPTLQESLHTQHREAPAGPAAEPLEEPEAPAAPAAAPLEAPEAPAAPAAAPLEAPEAPAAAPLEAPEAPAAAVPECRPSEAKETPGIGDSAMDDASKAGVAKDRTVPESVPDEGDAKAENGRCDGVDCGAEGLSNDNAVVQSARPFDLGVSVLAATNATVQEAQAPFEDAGDMDIKIETIKSTLTSEGSGEAISHGGEHCSMGENSAAGATETAALKAAGENQLDAGDYDDYSEDDDGAMSGAFTDPLRAAAGNDEGASAGRDQNQVIAAPDTIAITSKSVKSDPVESDSAEIGRALHDADTDDRTGHGSREQTPAAPCPAKKKAPIVWPEEERQLEEKGIEARQAQSRPKESESPVTKRAEEKTTGLKTVNPKCKPISSPLQSGSVEREPGEPKHKLIPPPPRSGSDVPGPARGLFAPVLGKSISGEYPSSCQVRHSGAALSS